MHKTAANSDDECGEKNYTYIYCGKPYALYRNIYLALLALI
jgi:hypothetical protein